jgi:hypothetical protein
VALHTGAGNDVKNSHGETFSANIGLLAGHVVKALGLTPG